MITLSLILKKTISKIKLRIKKEFDFSHMNFLEDYNRNYSKYSSNYRIRK